MRSRTVASASTYYAIYAFYFLGEIFKRYASISVYGIIFIVNITPRQFRKVQFNFYLLIIYFITRNRLESINNRFLML